MVIIKLAVIVGFIVVGTQYVRPENWQPFLPFGFHGVVGAPLLYFCFLGFDAVATAAEEVKRPQRNVPIGLLVFVHLYRSICRCFIRANWNGSVYGIKCC